LFKKKCLIYRLNFTGQQFQQRRLSDAVRADYCYARRHVNTKIQILEDQCRLVFVTELHAWKNAGELKMRLKKSKTLPCAPKIGGLSLVGSGNANFT
jgi:hypothetical protein